MPIRPENRNRYPAHWRELSERIRFERADGRCECTGQCGVDHLPKHSSGDWPFCDDLVAGRCAARNGEAHPVTGSRVVLTVAHLDHTPENCDPDNLRAMCQRCHLAYDRKQHATTAYMTRRCNRTREMFE